MSKIDKQKKYEIEKGKKQWKHNKDRENKKITSLSPQQHMALSILTSKRHSFKVAGAALYQEDSPYYESTWDYVDGGDNLCTFNRILQQGGFELIDFQIKGEDYPTNKRTMGYTSEEAVKIVIEMSDKVMEKIEGFLQEIDEKYGTSYAPSHDKKVKDEAKLYDYRKAQMLKR